MTVFLDACVIIYRIESVAPYHERFDTLIRRLTAAGHGSSFAVSRLSLLECRTKPLREDNAGLLARYDGFFASPGLSIVEITPAIIDLATQLRARFRLRTPDALQAASCLTLGPGIPFVTADRAFEKLTGLDVRVVSVES